MTNISTESKMNLRKVAELLNCRPIDLTIKDLEGLVQMGYEPIREPFMTDRVSYQWQDKMNDDGGYKPIDGKIAYKIKDEKGNYVDQLSFQKVSQGRGRKPKWYYFSETGYMSGRILYPDAHGTIMETIDYLTGMNTKLKQSKSFHVEAVDMDKFTFDGQMLSEELTVS